MRRHIDGKGSLTDPALGIQRTTGPTAREESCKTSGRCSGRHRFQAAGIEVCSEDSFGITGEFSTFSGNIKTGELAVAKWPAVSHASDTVSRPRDWSAMSNIRADQLIGEIFRVRPEHCPKTKQEKYKRLHFYVSRLGVALSDLLMESLLELRRAADGFKDSEIQQAALKAYSDEEYSRGVKELLCIWLHIEAMDQGGDLMPEWLLGFLRLAFGATDILIPQPRAEEVLNSYSHCTNEDLLFREATVKAGRALGFGKAATIFAPRLTHILLETGPVRQVILKEALVLPLDKIITYPLI